MWWGTNLQKVVTSPKSVVHLVLSKGRNTHHESLSRVYQRSEQSYKGIVVEVGQPLKNPPCIISSGQCRKTGILVSSECRLLLMEIEKQASDGRDRQRGEFMTGA